MKFCSGNWKTSREANFSKIEINFDFGLTILCWLGNICIEVILNAFLLCYYAHSLLLLNVFAKIEFLFLPFGTASTSWRGWIFSFICFSVAVFLFHVIIPWGISFVSLWMQQIPFGFFFELPYSDWRDLAVGLIIYDYNKVIIYQTRDLTLLNKLWC